jgi:hypothetical protein
VEAWFWFKVTEPETELGELESGAGYLQLSYLNLAASSWIPPLLDHPQKLTFTPS